MRFSSPRSTADWGGRVTRAEVDLDALAANVEALARHAAPARLMAVVKADAYGHGAVMVSHTALAHGASYLGVYTVGEGVALREAGISSPILVFGPFTTGEVRSIWDNRLTPTVTNREATERLISGAGSGTLPVHVKLDTGLNRAGALPGEAAELLAFISSHTRLEPEGIYTHFASADEPDRAVTLEQLRVFSETVSALEREGFRFALKHASNSAATLEFAEARFDLVRCGISLYGYYPSATVARDVPLAPALSLFSSVTRVHDIEPGAGVGYGHEFRAQRRSTIALAPIGYGDGLPRSLGNGAGRVLVRDGQAPIVGRVSMDQITLDVSDIPGVRVGDTVAIIGAQGPTEQTADDVAKQAGTISYDIVTGLLPRVPRLYTVGGTVRSVLSAGSRLESTAPRSTAARSGP